MSFKLFVKGTKALKLYIQIHILQKKKKNILHNFFSRQTTKVSHWPAVNYHYFYKSHTILVFIILLPFLFGILVLFGTKN